MYKTTIFSYFSTVKFYPYDFFKYSNYGFSYILKLCNYCVVFFMFPLCLPNYAMTVPDGFAFMHVNISHYRYYVCFYMRDVQKYITSH